MTQRNTFANNLGNEIRIGQKKSADYIRIAEKVLLNNEEIILSGLGNSNLKKKNESINFLKILFKSYYNCC